MGWSSSQRRLDLPPDWETIRSQVLREAGYVCEIDGCFSAADDVDHIRRGSDHSRRNLRALCSVHHDRKSSAEGVARKRELRSLRKRPLERHPGSTAS